MNANDAGAEHGEPAVHQLLAETLNVADEIVDRITHEYVDRELRRLLLRASLRSNLAEAHTATVPSHADPDPLIALNSVVLGPADWRQSPLSPIGKGAARRRLVALMACVVLVVFIAPVAAFLVARHDLTVGQPTDVTYLGPSVHSGMGAQACAVQGPLYGELVAAATPPSEQPVPMDGWVYYRDQKGFHITVGKDWRMSRVGGLLCFRDPTSRRLIAVYEVGRRSGNPKDLLADFVPQWITAANLTDFRQVSIEDLLMAEGGADLEYTYVAPDGVGMHGETRMQRVDGRLFLIFWLTTQSSWLADRALMNMVQPSFGVDS